LVYSIGLLAREELRTSARLDFTGVALRPGARPLSLEMLDAEGEALLATAQPQWALDPDGGGLELVNADLRIVPALARRLGDERLAGVTLGVLAFEAELGAGRPAGRALVRRAVAAATPPACGDWSGTIDVAIVDIDQVGQQGNPVGGPAGPVVVAPSVTLQNVGTANVPWWRKFTDYGSAPYGNDQHPFLVWQMALARDGELVPLGRNHVKHAFATGNTDCDPGACTHPHILGIGCHDLYGFASNTWNFVLAPRGEITASTGVWAHCDEPVAGTRSYFDDDANCAQETQAEGGDFGTHGMKVAQSSLGLAGGRYFVEAFYVVRGDVDIYDTMGVLEVVPTAPPMGGTTWTFPAARPFAQGPLLDAWVDPAGHGSDADNRRIDTGEGHLQLAVRVTSVPGGRRRYAYALANHDFDRRIRAFHVAFPGGAEVNHLAFADGDDSAANDWTTTVDATGVTWTAPAATDPPAELDWGSIASFRLETEQLLPAAEVTLTALEAGATSEVTTTPSTPVAFSDGFEAGDASVWSGSAQ
jgi:hypothetical protein